jgi:hypothetical protein
MPRLVRIIGVLLAVVGVFVVASLFGARAANSASTQQALKVIEQNNPAFSPFQVELTPKSGFCQTVDVPAGKRLVIEYVSARIEDPSSREISITTTAGGTTVPHWIPLTEPFVTISNAAQDVRLYADPGTQVQACVDGLGQVTLSGHLVAVNA